LISYRKFVFHVESLFPESPLCEDIFNNDNAMTYYTTHFYGVTFLRDDLPGSSIRRVMVLLEFPVPDTMSRAYWGT
jgi:hypothetical protein